MIANGLATRVAIGVRREGSLAASHPTGVASWLSACQRVGYRRGYRDEPQRQLSLEDELEDFGDWMLKLRAKNLETGRPA